MILSHPFLYDVHPILDDSSHPVCEPLDLAFRCSLLHSKMQLKDPRNYTPRCNLKDPRNILYNIIHRPEEALDIQSELIFVNGMVHLPHE